MTIEHRVMFHSFSSRPTLDLQLTPLALARDACLLEFESLPLPSLDAKPSVGKHYTSLYCRYRTGPKPVFQF